VLRRHLPEAHYAGGAHPWGGREKAVTAIGGLAKDLAPCQKIQTTSFFFLQVYYYRTGLLR
jgi:hypothetical protein